MSFDIADRSPQNDEDDPIARERVAKSDFARALARRRQKVDAEGDHWTKAENKRTDDTSADVPASASGGAALQAIDAADVAAAARLGFMRTKSTYENRDAAATISELRLGVDAAKKGLADGAAAREALEDALHCECVAREAMRKELMQCVSDEQQQRIDQIEQESMLREKLISELRLGVDAAKKGLADGAAAREALEDALHCECVAREAMRKELMQCVSDEQQQRKDQIEQEVVLREEFSSMLRQKVEDQHANFSEKVGCLRTQMEEDIKKAEHTIEERFVRLHSEFSEQLSVKLQELGNQCIAAVERETRDREGGHKQIHDQIQELRHIQSKATENAQMIEKELAHATAQSASSLEKLEQFSDHHLDFDKRFTVKFGNMESRVQSIEDHLGKSNEWHTALIAQVQKFETRMNATEAATRKQIEEQNATRDIQELRVIQAASADKVQAVEEQLTHAVSQAACSLETLEKLKELHLESTSNLKAHVATVESNMQVMITELGSRVEAQSALVSQVEKVEARLDATEAATKKQIEEQSATRDIQELRVIQAASADKVQAVEEQLTNAVNQAACSLETLEKLKELHLESTSTLKAHVATVESNMQVMITELGSRVEAQAALVTQVEKVEARLDATEAATKKHIEEQNAARDIQELRVIQTASADKVQAVEEQLTHAVNQAACSLEGLEKLKEMHLESTSSLKAHVVTAESNMQAMISELVSRVEAQAALVSQVEKVEARLDATEAATKRQTEEQSAAHDIQELRVIQTASADKVQAVEEQLIHAVSQSACSLERLEKLKESHLESTSTLKAHVATVESSMQAMITELGSRVEAQAALVAQVEKVEARVASVESSMQNEVENQTVSKEVQEIRRMQTASTENVGVMEERLAQTIAQASSSSQGLERLANQFTESEANFISLASQVQSLDSKLENGIEGHAALVVQLDDVKNLVRILEHTLQKTPEEPHASSNLQDIRIMQSACEEKVQAMGEQFTCTAAQVASSLEKLDALRDQLRESEQDLKASFTTLESRVHGIEAGIGNSGETNGILMKQVESFRNRIEAVAHDVQKTAEEHTTLKNHLSERVTNVTNESINRLESLEEMVQSQKMAHADLCVRLGEAQVRWEEQTPHRDTTLCNDIQVMINESLAAGSERGDRFANAEQFMAEFKGMIAEERQLRLDAADEEARRRDSCRLEILGIIDEDRGLRDELFGRERNTREDAICDLLQRIESSCSSLMAQLLERLEEESCDRKDAFEQLSMKSIESDGEDFRRKTLARVEALEVALGNGDHKSNHDVQQVADNIERLDNQTSVLGRLLDEERLARNEGYAAEVCARERALRDISAEFTQQLEEKHDGREELRKELLSQIEAFQDELAGHRANSAIMQKEHERIGGLVEELTEKIALHAQNQSELESSLANMHPKCDVERVVEELRADVELGLEKLTQCVEAERHAREDAIHREAVARAELLQHEEDVTRQRLHGEVHEAIQASTMPILPQLERIQEAIDAHTKLVRQLQDESGQHRDDLKQESAAREEALSRESDLRAASLVEVTSKLDSVARLEVLVKTLTEEMSRWQTVQGEFQKRLDNWDSSNSPADAHAADCTNNAEAVHQLEKKILQETEVLKDTLNALENRLKGDITATRRTCSEVAEVTKAHEHKFTELEHQLKGDIAITRRTCSEVAEATHAHEQKFTELIRRVQEDISAHGGSLEHLGTQTKDFSRLLSKEALTRCNFQSEIKHRLDTFEEGNAFAEITRRLEAETASREEAMLHEANARQADIAELRRTHDSSECKLMVEKLRDDFEQLCEAHAELSRDAFGQEARQAFASEAELPNQCVPSSIIDAEKNFATSADTDTRIEDTSLWEQRLNALRKEMEKKLADGLEREQRQRCKVMADLKQRIGHERKHRKESAQALTVTRESHGHQSQVSHALHALPEDRAEHTIDKHRKARSLSNPRIVQRNNENHNQHQIQGAPFLLPASVARKHTGTLPPAPPLPAPDGTPNLPEPPFSPAGVPPALPSFPTPK